MINSPSQDPIYSLIPFLCPIGAALCANNPFDLKECFHRALANNVPTRAVREVIITSYLFDGYPTALEGFRLWREVYGKKDEASDTIKYSPAQLKVWRQRGLKLCRQVYGEHFRELMRRVRDWAPELKEGMIIEGYGKVLSRDQIPIELRELVIITMLIVKQRPRQLVSHIYGAARLGVPLSLIESTLRYAQPYLTIDQYEEYERMIYKTLKQIAEHHS